MPGLADRNITDEQPAARGDTRVQPRAEDQAIPVVIDRSLDPDPEPERPAPLAQLVADPADPHRHPKPTRPLAQRPSEQMDVAIDRPPHAFDPPSRDSPILERVRPVFRPKPDAIHECLFQAAGETRNPPGAAPARDFSTPQPRSGDQAQSGRRVCQELSPRDFIGHDRTFPCTGLDTAFLEAEYQNSA